MSKTNLVTNGTNKHQEALVSVHSKWTATSEKDKFSGFKTASQSNNPKGSPGNDNAWGPLFKSRSHFNEMHMF